MLSINSECGLYGNRWKILEKYFQKISTNLRVEQSMDILFIKDATMVNLLMSEIIDMLYHIIHIILQNLIPILMLRYAAQSVKYIYKYVYKGSESATIEIRGRSESN